MPIEDWDILAGNIRVTSPHLFLQGENQQARLKDWTTNRLTEFCKNHALPLLQQPLETPRKPANPDITLCIPEIELSGLGATNLEVLKQFAAFKNETMTSIIRHYIINPALIEQEVRICQSIILLK